MRKTAEGFTRFSMLYRFCVLLSVLLLSAGTALAEPEPPLKAAGPEKLDIIVADFEEATPEGFEVLRAEIELTTGSDGAPEGKGFIEISILKDQRSAAQLLFALPEKTDLSRCKLLSAHLYLPERDRQWKLRWHVLDKDKNQIHQRMFKLDGSGEWQKIEWPLALWRWSNSRIGDWSEARYLVLNLEEGDGKVKLDGVRFVPGDRGAQSAMPKPDWVATVAFSGQVHSLNKRGVFIATDATEVLAEKDLEIILEKSAPIRDWIRANFKKALRTVGGDAPVSLLIFKDMDGYKDFYKKLGDKWNVSIGAPGAGGYTVQDISASTYSARYGADRPVYFHELVHAIVSRELRLLPGNRRHSWLQEGFANYLQLCLYPQSIGRSTLGRNFFKPVTNRSFFKPLKTLLNNRISGRNYAQLASLVAFLVARQPEWLDEIAAGIGSGKDITKVIEEDLETTYDDIQEKWLAWGKKAYAPDAEPPEGPGTHFPMPKQWKPEKETPEEEGEAGEEKTPEKEEPKKEPRSEEF